jgi:23S rRNA (uracil1939-C5)-methyltransferase
MAQVQISSMTFGPYGIGRTDGKSLMVPNAAPGDILDVAIEHEHRDYAVAGIRQILQPGPDRRVPPCPFVPRCGGCDWQQINYPAQVRLKGELLAAEFKRAFGLELDPVALVIPAPAEFGYRARIRLKVGEGGVIGFHEANSRRLVPIDHCMLASNALAAPAMLARALGRHCLEIESASAENGVVLIARLKRLDAKISALASDVLENSEGAIRGIVLKTEHEREVLGNAVVVLELEPGLELLADADQFSQVNREQNVRLIATVMEMAEAGAGSTLLDLFCGAGNFSLPAARRGARVTAIDCDSLAIAAAARNAQRMGLSDVQFVAMKAAEAVRFVERAGLRPDSVILDPPRSGARDVMEVLGRLRPHAVVYVSCDPSTLVRDLAMLSTKGYRVIRVRAFDFFPNTHHVEVAVQTLLT